MPTQISVSTLPTIQHHNTPCITTELLSSLYGTESDYIRKNHSRNSERFMLGKHYFLLKGEELREFKHCMSLRPSVKIARNVRSLILWTERGAARHAKMLETDQAWEVFEKLEDCYFNKKAEEKSRKIQAGKITLEQQEAIKQLVLSRGKSVPQEHQAKATITLWSSLKCHYGCSYKEINAEQFTEALSIVARVPLVGELLERAAPQIQTQPQSIFTLPAIDQDGEWRLKIKDGRVTSVRRLDDGEIITSIASFGELMERAGNIIIHYTELQRMNPSELVGLVDKMRKHHHHWQLIMNQKNKIA